VTRDFEVDDRKLDVRRRVTDDLDACGQRL